MKLLQKIFNKRQKPSNEVLHIVSGSCLEKADFWYCIHKNHVNKLYNSVKTGYPPIESLDINNPELWKAEHWKWYLDNYR